jgi:hypothetical protein
MKSLLAILILGVVPTLAAPSAACGVPRNYVPPTVTTLPDPFVFVDGSKVTTKTEWACRQQQIAELFQRFELGTKPPKPSSFSASFSGNTLSITAGNDGKSITFNTSIAYPTNGTAPFAAFIAVGGISIPVPDDIAVITLNNDNIALENDQSSRGVGQFYDLYGSNHSAGALMAWAWAASRIIDGLEDTKATNRINIERIGVSGCSRDAKGALVIGAFDDRIALTVPQESGSGGAACWRVSDQQFAAGTIDQTAMEIVQENVWFSPRFDTWSNRTSQLAIDHHELAGLVAPRGLYATENDIVWLGPVSTTTCMDVGRLIYKAVGVPVSLYSFHNSSSEGMG